MKATEFMYWRCLVRATFALLALVVAGCAQPEPTPTPTSTPTPHTTRQTIELDLGKKIALKLVRIEPGKFTMGSPQTEKGHMPVEAQHEVTISKAFYMGTTHVTVDQFATFVEDTGYKTDAEKEGTSTGMTIKDGKPGVMLNVAPVPWRQTPPRFGQKGDHPVVWVSWNDAKAFCDWLSKKTRMTVRLPTEAEWEYACRAGTQTAYPWGDSADDGKGWANCADRSLNKALYACPADMFFGWNDGFVYTSPVARFKANAFGLYDMVGNACQWCDDWAGTLRVLRGGSWSGGPTFCRCAKRYANALTKRTDNFGFRICVNIP